MRRMCLVAAVWFAVGMPAAAQETPAADWYSGYQLLYVRDGENEYRLHGFNTSVNVHLNRWVGLVGELTGAYGDPRFTLPGPTLEKRDARVHTFMFGPRVTVRNSTRVQPFAHVLVGGARMDQGPLGPDRTNTNFAMAAGGGFDLRVNNRLSLRMVQADYMLTRFEIIPNRAVNQHHGRFTGGIVLHFGSRD